MPVTTLDRKTALIIIDLQNGIVAMAAANGIADVVTRAAALAEAFRRHGLPVVLVNVSGASQGRNERGQPPREFPAGFTDFVPELDRQPSDVVVTKRTWGAFTNTDLEAKLKEAEATQLVIAGVATSVGVESTARQAHELGFNLTLATDAMTDLVPAAHANSLAHIFPRLAETGSTAEIIALLDKSR